MSKSPVVSVIMPFYNTPQAFLEEAIKSVLAQSYPNWELLLIDDGSTPEISALTLRYASDHPDSIYYFEHGDHQNRGISASRNLGIAHSTGEFVAFLDADDIWLPHKLQRQVELMSASAAVVMLYGRTMYWHSWSNHPVTVSEDFFPRLGVAPGVLIPPPKLLLQYLQGEAAIPCTCSILVRRDALNEVDGFEAAFTGMYEDQVFYAKICLTGPVMVVDECWDRYRQHSGSISSISLDERQARTDYLRWLDGYLNSTGNNSQKIRKALQRELRRCDESLQPTASDKVFSLYRRTRKLWRRLTEASGISGSWQRPAIERRRP